MQLGHKTKITCNLDSNILILVDNASCYYNPNSILPTFNSTNNSYKEGTELAKTFVSRISNIRLSTLQNNQSQAYKLQYATSSYNTFIKQKNIIIKLSVANLDSSVLLQVNKYFELNNSYIFTIEELSNTEIVELVIVEQQHKEHDSDDSDEESLTILASKGLVSLKKFLEFFEQQTNRNFKSEDLDVF
ncbi:22529_t:CDS:2 [Cetraspora pellucida]|uniref:22529_t:CDS:1 n=1 Tax=Cetraspora pellucida TaxID=1433469 RepID=A0A9N9H2S7_9GLOM|nr:22529_t:CDS:2 [Cetraspora pellucida]